MGSKSCSASTGSQYCVSLTPWCSPRDDKDESFSVAVDVVAKHRSSCGGCN